MNRRSERGAALIEYAMVLPVLLLLTLGSLEVFRLFFVQQSLRTGLKQILPCACHWQDEAYRNEYCQTELQVQVEQLLDANPLTRRKNRVTVWPDTAMLDIWEPGTVFELMVAVDAEWGFLYPFPGGPSYTLRESVWTFVGWDPPGDLAGPRDDGALPLEEK